MKELLIASTVCNVLLILVCIWLARRLGQSLRTSEAAAKRERDQALRHEAAVIHVQETLGALAVAAADTIVEVRRDIDRNYQHVHEGHVLDRIADLVRHARPGGMAGLDPHAWRSVQELGGAGFVTADGYMPVSKALEFAWMLHAEARKGAEQLYGVVQESCGPTERAAWLSKSLALYERIWGYDKAAAIASLEAVLHDWKYVDLQVAVKAVRQ